MENTKDSLIHPVKVSNKDSVPPSGFNATSSEAKFIIHQYPEDANGMPTSNIEISYAGKTTAIKKISGEARILDKEEYREKQIPVNALSACGAWWAGAGDYFYLIMKDHKLQVWQGWQAEEQEDRGYHWEKVKEM